VQLYTRQLTSRVKQPLRQLRAFTRVELAPGEQRTVTLTFPVANLAHWDVLSGSMLVEPARYRVLAGRSSGDVRLSAELEVPGEAPPAARPRVWRAVDFDECSETAIVPLRPADVDAPDAVAGLSEGSWLRFGAAELSGCTAVELTLGGKPGRVSLRAGDPFAGPLLAAADSAGEAAGPTSTSTSGS